MSKKIISSTFLIVLLILPFIFIILPADYFDTGETLCPSKRFLDLECLGCGLTRGIQHLIHFDIETGMDYNKLSPIVLIIIIYFWIKLFIKHIFIVFPKQSPRS